MTKDELLDIVEGYSDGRFRKQLVITAIDNYSDTLIAAKAFISGSLPSYDDIAQAAEDHLQLDRVATKDDVYDAGHFVAGAIWMQERLVGNCH